MGSGYSQEDYERISLEVYKAAGGHTCLLPDVGIDESLLKYSGLDSNAEVWTYSNELLSTVPDYVDRLASNLAPLTSVPNAVGLGALVLSMIMEICMKSTTQTSEDSYSLLRRVFGEEKASAVRDTMFEYVKRHRMSMKNNQDLLQELQTLERRLSHELTTLRSSLLLDGQMSTRGLKIWVNGASFHVQMLIHKARLNIQTGQGSSNYVDSISAAITLYMEDLSSLLEKYRTYKISTIVTHDTTVSYDISFTICTVTNTELNCEQRLYDFDHDANRFCNRGFWSNTDPKMVETFMNHVYSKYEPITGLKTHFSNMKKNLRSLINQHDSFIVPSRA